MLRIQNIKIRENISDKDLIHFVIKKYHIERSEIGRAHV